MNATKKNAKRQGSDENNEKTINIGQEVLDLKELLNSVNRKIRKQYDRSELDLIEEDIKKLLQSAKQKYTALIDNTTDQAKKEGEENKEHYEQIKKNFDKLDSQKNSLKGSEIDGIYETIFQNYNCLKYSFRTAAAETKNVLGKDHEVENPDIILLCKNVRIMEDIINKICTNNIDKSIIGGEKHFDSMRYGFEWLFCHDDISQNKSGHRHLDIRDCNRYLDYIKYQIMLSKKSIEKPFMTPAEVDDIFDKIRYAFDHQKFNEKTQYINTFKMNFRILIKEFFEIYELLIKYRDALFKEEEIRKALEDKPKKEPDPSSRINLEIVNLSSVAVRVLLDRFVSFVKISDLNFGNSTFNRAWFNYSELSKSNYAGSDFKEARIENAKMKDCDISTCNLILADGGNTDFSGSNFNYSDLSGINLVDAVVNQCEFQNAIFYDANIQGYKAALREYFDSNNSERNDDVPKRIIHLYDAWQKISSEKRTPADLIGSIISAYKDSLKKKSDPEFSLQITGAGGTSWAILDTTKLKNAAFSVDASDKKIAFQAQISEYMSALMTLFLQKSISAELFQYARDFLLTQTENARRAREETYGNIFLDVADLTNVSAKGAQLSGNDLSYVKMPQSSFENADLSGTTMHYSNGASAAFIMSNLNHAECFESDYHLANFSSALLNNALFLNCNLNHTNWNKAILVGTAFVDLSEYVEAICKGSNAGSPEVQILQLEKNVSFESARNNAVIRDTTHYESVAKKLVLPEESRDFWQYECSINYATFTNVLADRTVFLGIIADRSSFNGTSAKNSFWVNCRAHLSDFIETDLRYSALILSCFGQSNFSKANLSNTNIQYVDFSNSNMNCALLNLSNIDHALFRNCNLKNINFSEATICNCAFEDSKFDEAILSYAKFKNCIFSSVSFTGLVDLHSSEWENCLFDNCALNDDIVPNGISSLKEALSEV